MQLPNGLPNDPPNDLLKVAIQTLLADIAPDSGWGRRLKNLFNEHPTVNLRAMQFPADWQNLPRWN